MNKIHSFEFVVLCGTAKQPSNEREREGERYVCMFMSNDVETLQPMYAQPHDTATATATNNNFNSLESIHKKYISVREVVEAAALVANKTRIKCMYMFVFMFIMLNPIHTITSLTE